MKKYRFRNLLIISLTLNILAAIGCVAVLDKKGGLPWLNRKVIEVFHPQQAERIRGSYENNKLSVYEQLPVEPDDIIFLGDSILDYGEWHEYLNNGHIKNRAINGADTHIILNNLKQIIEGHPRHVVLLCGINNFQKHMSYTQTTNEYAQIVSMISSQPQQTDIWLLPVFPVNKRLYKQWIVAERPDITVPNQTEVEALNAFIRKLAVDMPHTHFVDVPSVLNNKGELGEDFTFDGLHLNGQGLKKIAISLRQSYTETRMGVADRSGHLRK